MIPFLNRNDEKWPHTRQIKIVGRNHILPPLGIEIAGTLVILFKSLFKSLFIRSKDKNTYIMLQVNIKNTLVKFTSYE